MFNIETKTAKCIPFMLQLWDNFLKYSNFQEKIMTKYSNHAEIVNKIKLIRKEMIDSGLKKGFSHPETVKLSQELDQFMNKLTMFKF